MKTKPGFMNSSNRSDCLSSSYHTITQRSMPHRNPGYDTSDTDSVVEIHYTLYPFTTRDPDYVAQIHLHFISSF